MQAQNFRPVYGMRSVMWYMGRIRVIRTASDAGLPAIVRAVANAVGANAMSVIIPCHRIIGRGDGRLTGYAGGLEAKRYLLELERHSNRL